MEYYIDLGSSTIKVYEYNKELTLLEEHSIYFKNNFDKEKGISKENFDELFQDFDISILADKSITKETLKKELEQFYSTEKQEKYGVLGIRVELERKEYVSKKWL